MEENKLEQVKTNGSKKNNVLISILLIIIMALLLILIYVLITNPAVKKENKNKENEINEKENNKEEEKDNNFYLIYYFENCLIGIKADGSKEILVSGVTNKFISYSIYDNNLYYIDNIQNVHSLDLKTRKDTNLNIKVSEDDNWNMYAGKDFLILSGVRKVFKYNLSDGKGELLPFENFNSNYLDNSNNFYYTGRNNKLYSYNINTKETLLVADDSRVIYGSENSLIYAKHDSGGDSEDFYLYDSKTKTSTLYKDIDLNCTFIYEGKIFAIDENKVIALDSNEKEVIVTFDDIDMISSIHLVKDSILVNTADIDEEACKDADDVCLPPRTFNSYLVNIKTKKIEKLDNSYEILFENIPSFVYVK